MGGNFPCRGLEAPHSALGLVSVSAVAAVNGRIRPSGTTSSPGDFPPTGEGVEAMGAPHAIFKQSIPESERMSRIRDRRFVAVDQEKGIVFAFGFFDHHRINWTWQLAGLFRIENGQIRRIETIFHRAPFGMASGWSTYEQSMSGDAQDVR